MSTANLVRLYLRNKPYLTEALESGIVNLSALSRLIQHDLRVRDYYAVKAAVRRHYQHMEKARQSIEQRALAVLKGNRITLLEGISLLISEKEIDLKNNVKIKLGEYYYYLADSRTVLKKSQKESLLKRHDNCSAIIVHSAENVESVPGVMAFVTSLFAEYNINIIGLISCYTENIFVINRADTMKGYELVSEIVK